MTNFPSLQGDSSFSSEISQPIEVFPPTGQIFSLEDTFTYVDQQLQELPIILHVTKKYIASHLSHPMNIVAYLRDSSRREEVINILKETNKELPLSLEQFKAFIDLSMQIKNPFLGSKDEEFNYQNGQRKTDIQKMKLLSQHKDLYDIGSMPSALQVSLLQQHVIRLVSEVLPALTSNLEEIVMPLITHGFPIVNTRAKTVDGILDKIRRKRSGITGKYPHPDYVLADFPDTVGGRITVLNTEQLQQVAFTLEQKYGNANIIEKDNFYTSKKRHAPYRVITYTILVNGVPCEVQLSSLRSSLTADLWHNTGYKRLHPDLTEEEIGYMFSLQMKAAAFEHTQLANL